MKRSEQGFRKRGDDNTNKNGNNYNNKNNNSKNENKYTAPIQHQLQSHSQSFPPQTVLSSDIQIFWESIHKRITSKKTQTSSAAFDIPNQDCHLWHKCWSAAAAGAGSTVGKDALSTLAAAYLSLVCSERYHPPMKHVLQVLVRILQAELVAIQSLSRAAATSASRKLSATSPLSLVANILGDRLVIAVDAVISKSRSCSGTVLQTDSSAEQDLLNTLENVANEAIYLSQRFFDLSEREKLTEISSTFSQRVASLRRNLKRFEELRAEERAAGAGEEMMMMQEREREPQWSGWRSSPTVGWLMSSSWLEDVPHGRSQYESPAEYAECLLRVWTLLTFYWGAAAVSPKCSQRGHGDAQDFCNQPLIHACTHLPRLSHRGTASCTAKVQRQGQVTQLCGKSARWRCFRASHDALCHDCWQRRQDVCVGAPGGPGASTDIYDAVVERETFRNEGVVVLLADLTSRKPPAVAPNWRTSYRLTTGALVAVAQLAAKGEALSRRLPVFWAEVVDYSVGDPRNADGRSRGRLAVRLLTKGDCASLQVAAKTSLASGSRVALIDLRVFVPEAVSVLATFSDSSFPDHLQRIPFIHELIGQPGKITQAVIPSSGIGGTGGILAVIEKAVMTSDMRLLRQLSEEQKRDIIARIYALSPVRSLYGTQLDAFALSLTNAAHCIQGPPGTGKVLCSIYSISSLPPSI